ncbi:MAG: magnesium/cobalt transporter CorA, partial [Kiritimatiellaceae bacterium]|nr:magnesium/cobalt transporter CorA [Kiritimatiellaceae bacterium]
EETRIDIVDYTEGELVDHTVDSLADCEAYLARDSITWIKITGLKNVELLKSIGERFNLSPLVLEDILDTGKRPKLEDHDDCLFLIVRLLCNNSDEDKMVSEQVSMLVGPNYVISFQEIDSDSFSLIHQRILDGKGRIRKKGSDYLAYALLDAIVDNYFVILEDLGDHIENLQDSVLEKEDPENLRKIHTLKQKMVIVRKAVLPIRELASSMEKNESELIAEDLAPYLRDVYEHTIQIIDLMEMLRDMLDSTLNTYMTTVSNRMNEVMKVLTIIATIFIPLTFIAGIYGMNFENMPELRSPIGYVAVWIVMIAMAGGMLSYFRRKKWI